MNSAILFKVSDLWLRFRGINVAINTRHLVIFFILLSVTQIVQADGIVSIRSSDGLVGEEGTLTLSLDQAPKGLSGYSMTVNVDNPQIIRFTQATFPEWASLSEAEPSQNNGYSLRAIDLQGSIEAGSVQIPLATLSFTALNVGTCQVSINIEKFDDDLGDIIQVQTDPGTITIRSEEQEDQTMKITLFPGWNFISIPGTLKSGSDTAAIFANVPSEGHSVFNYDPDTGWKTVNQQEILRPMQAYWLYTTESFTVSLNLQDISGSSRSLKQGWNIIGINGSKIRSAEDALSSLSGWTYIIAFDSGSQQYGQTIIRGNTELGATMTPGAGYWIYLTTPGVLLS